MKVDLIDTGMSNLKKQIPLYRKYNLKLLAEKVETREEFETCKKLGFDYFQGYFLKRPNIVEGKKLPESRFSVLRVLSELQKSDLEIRDLESIISHDVSLSYKLLKLINSSFFGTKERVNTLLQALTLLGIRQIKQWVSLIFLAKVDDKPRDLLITAMVRGKMCELLAKSLNYKDADKGFTIDLFSVLELLPDLPLEEILSQLPLSDEVNGALLRQEGKLGKVLECVIAYEREKWDEVAKSGYGAEKVFDAYLQSIEWATSVGFEL